MAEPTIHASDGFGHLELPTEPAVDAKGFFTDDLPSISDDSVTPSGESLGLGAGLPALNEGR